MDAWQNFISANLQNIFSPDIDLMARDATNEIHILESKQKCLCVWYILNGLDSILTIYFSSIYHCKGSGQIRKRKNQAMSPNSEVHLESCLTSKMECFAWAGNYSRFRKNTPF